MKKFLLPLLFCLGCLSAFAQDAVLISEGNFERGVVQGTNFQSVAILRDDNTVKEYQAKDVQSFIWNGETYESKPYIFGKKAEVRFFKLIESGKVNLYAYGQPYIIEGGQPAQQGPRVRPNVGVGMGSGGFGNGLGGGLSIDLSKRRAEEPARKIKGKVIYFLEKPGTGPMIEISLDGSKIAGTKSLLLNKLSNDEDLAERIKATEVFDEKNLPAFVKAYNDMHK